MNAAQRRPDKPAVLVRLEAPWTVGGLPASRLAVLLLAQAAAGQAIGQPFVQAQNLLANDASQQAFAMALSRAFGQFRRAGIAVGWGSDMHVPPSALPVRGRVHGPFWLAPHEARRLQFIVNDSITHPGDWLAQMRPPVSGQAVDASAHDGLPQRLSTWLQMLVLRQTAEEGRLSALHTMQAYGLLASTQSGNAPPETGTLWALMLQARYARLGNHVEEARRLYTRLLREARHTAAASRTTHHRLDIVQALAEVGMAWCDQQAHRSLAAWRRLQKLAPRFDPGVGAATLWLSSRLAGEYFNLRALVRRAMVLDGCERATQAAAMGIVQDFELALQCAVESDSLTLMEAVASNLGYTLWLLAQPLQTALGADAGRIHAVRWILAGEALCHRHGIGSGSYWNIIYLCRVARGATAEILHAGDDDTATAAKAPSKRHHAPHRMELQQRVLTLANLRAQLATPSAPADSASLQLRALCDLLLPPPMKDWLTLTERLLAAVMDEGDAVKPAQRCAAMLERLWQLVLAGQEDEAHELRPALQSAIKALPANQRRYFHYELRQMPLK